MTSRSPLILPADSTRAFACGGASVGPQYVLYEVASIPRLSCLNLPLYFFLPQIWVYASMSPVFLSDSESLVGLLRFCGFLATDPALINRVKHEFDPK